MIVSIIGYRNFGKQNQTSGLDGTWKSGKRPIGVSDSSVISGLKIPMGYYKF